MLPIETVRVRNPNAPDTFMTINRSDLQPHHEPWAVQRDQDPAFLAATAAARMDPAERDLMARLFEMVIARRHGFEVSDWRAQPLEDRMALLRAAEVEIANMPEPPADDDGVAGETDEDVFVARYDAPGGPIDATRGPSGAFTLRRDGSVLQTGLMSLDEAQAAAEEIAASEKPVDEPGTDLTVAKGPGGRWFVLRGEERVSKGFATEGEAMTELAARIQGGAR
ncbi:hypothetical protein DK419_13125 [Methylobacterium terrae]|uniref:Uncharacterized protein n=1 Tax=Methylobacterium terrae TaxID=2202827 RepID=A0A2U8WNQ1_9HYPH|nr:hypothetical protein [Methylobacterium terrae]AWN47138.1 hypothetical protein DK419_13125 [Methylobacterium terrae]